MSRITDKDLSAVVSRINRETKSPDVYSLNGVLQVGHFHISHAYGGVNLCRLVNTAGGCSDVFSRGHMPKRELYELMHAWLRGFDFARVAS